MKGESKMNSQQQRSEDEHATEAIDGKAHNKKPNDAG